MILMKNLLIYLVIKDNVEVSDSLRIAKTLSIIIRRELDRTGSIINLIMLKKPHGLYF